MDFLSSDEKRCIEAFAGGDASLRDKAIEIYRRHIRYFANAGEPVSPHLLFMSEIDTVVPDLYMRAHYRNKLKKDGAVMTFERYKAKTEDMVNEVGDLCMTAVVTDQMSLDEVIAYYQDRLNRIYEVCRCAV